MGSDDLSQERSLPLYMAVRPGDTAGAGRRSDVVSRDASKVMGELPLSCCRSSAARDCPLLPNVPNRTDCSYVKERPAAPSARVVAGRGAADDVLGAGQGGRPYRRGAIVGLRLTMNRLAAIILPPITGAIADGWGTTASFVILGPFLRRCAPISSITRRAPPLQAAM